MVEGRERGGGEKLIKRLGERAGILNFVAVQLLLMDVVRSAALCRAVTYHTKEVMLSLI